MTLTTEQLRAIAEEELDACATLDSAKLMARELLANREAQPVGYAENGTGFIYPPERRDRIKNPVAVYTAPPAPAARDGWKLVPVEPTAEMINAALASGALSIRTVYRVMLAAAPEGGNDHDTGR